MNTKVETISTSLHSTQSTTYRFYPWLIVLMSSLFLFYKYIMQVSPSIMTSELMSAFHINGTGLGNLAATFFYSYLITQLFVGVLLDKFSPRYLSAAAILAGALGTYYFAVADTLFMAGMARALMGVGAAFATVSYLKLSANWFSAKKFAFVSGLLATAAMLGAMFGQAPLAWLVSSIGWRHSLILCAMVGASVAALFVLLVREKPAVALEPNLKPISNNVRLHDILQILKSKQNWVLTLYSGMAFSPIAVFGGLWGNPFIAEAYHLSTTKAASLVSLIFLGLAFGGPLLGYVSDRLQNRRHVMFYGSLLCFAAVTAVIYSYNLPLWAVGSLLFLFGFGTGAYMLGFSIGKESNPLYLAATVVALINTGDAIMGAVTEPFIGKLLDLGWDGKIVQGAHYFSVSNYHHAFIILSVYLFVASFLVLKMKHSTK